MEIVHIVLGKANPNRMNGVNKVVYQLATEQEKANRNVQVWGVTKNTERNFPPRVFKTRLFKSSQNPFEIPVKLRKAILNNKSTVFHLHGGWIPLFYALGMFFKRHGIQFIVTPHGAYNTIAMKKNNIFKKLYFNTFERQLLKNATRIHAIGKSEIEGLSKIYPNDKSYLLQYGFKWDLKAQTHKKNEKFIIGFMGRLDTYTKGLDLLIQSFEIFSKPNKNVALWIIGDGVGTQFLQQYIKENNVQNVVLWGQKFGSEKEELLSQLSVFIHPSRNEGLPSSILEASSFGIPSIVTDSTNVGDFIEHYNAGYKAQNENIKELIDGLEHFYAEFTNHEMDKYKKANFKMLEEQFSWSVLIPKFDLLYAS